MNGGSRASIQLAAPRDPFPSARATSSGLAASQYTQTSPTPARGTQYALSVSWCSLDHRLRRPKKGSPCTLGFINWAQAQDLLVEWGSSTLGAGDGVRQVFKHFCAGEHLGDVLEVRDFLSQAAGVRLLVDESVEERSRRGIGQR